MRIVAISDTHGFHEEVSLPLGDVLVHAGDFMNSGRRVHEAVRFFSWLVRQPHPHKIVIAGNHDCLFETDPGLARSLVRGAHYLEDSGVEIEYKNEKRYREDHPKGRPMAEHNAVMRAAMREAPA